jgi:hypothetical protein
MTRSANSKWAFWGTGAHRTQSEQQINSECYRNKSVRKWKLFCQGPPLHTQAHAHQNEKGNTTTTLEQTHAHTHTHTHTHTHAHTPSISRKQIPPAPTSVIPQIPSHAHDAGVMTQHARFLRASHYREIRHNSPKWPPIGRWKFQWQPFLRRQKFLFRTTTATSTCSHTRRAGKRASRSRLRCRG